MTALQAELAEFSTGFTTEVTQKIETAPAVARQRRPEDGEVERIVLRHRTGEGRGEAEFRGATAWAMSDLMLFAWASAIDEEPDVEFSIVFGDGEVFRGNINVRRHKNLATHCRRIETFRSAFCPTLMGRAVVEMQRFFMSTYAIPRPCS